MLDTLYPLAEERDLARVPDVQGLGGSSTPRGARRTR